VTLANQLTILRMVLAPVLLGLVLDEQMVWAFGVFVAAGLTDFLDGLSARWRNERTLLGAVLDPLADKLLLSLTYIALTWGPVKTAVPVWLAVLILGRDVIIVVSVAIVNMAVGKRVFFPSLIGKASTAVQLVTAAVVLLLNATGGTLPHLRWLYVLTLALTAASSAHYLYLAGVRAPVAPEAG
jgi:cardiolipin synthase